MLLPGGSVRQHGLPESSRLLETAQRPHAGLAEVQSDWIAHLTEALFSDDGAEEHD